jgi:hypothetical protein
MKKIVFLLTLVALVAFVSEVMAQPAPEKPKEAVLYIVKSVVSSEYVNQFDEWYHKKHIPEFIKVSGCKTGRRFKTILPEDKYMYMAIYEFSDKETFLKYQSSEGKKVLLKDFSDNFAGKAELKASAWEQIFP